jgi:DNA-binding NtrC family response regulator
MLTHLGFTVVAAADATQAVDVFRARHSELVLVLLDLTIPGDADQFRAELAREDRRTPIVLSSGSGAGDFDRRFAGRKVAGFLQKPFRLDELRSTVHDALSAS